MWFYESLVAAVIFAGAGLLFKVSHQKQLDSSSFFFYLYACGALVLFVYLIIVGQFQVSVPILFSGLLIGCGLALGNWLFIKALNKGPISLTSPIINTNIVFLVLAAVVFYNESLSALQIVLVGLLILSLLILPIDTHASLKIKSLSWYALVVLASLFFAVRNGGLKVTEEAGMNNHVVLFYAYAIPALAFLLSKPKKYHLEKQALLCGSTAGVLSIFGMSLYAQALSSGPASIVIPIFSTYNVIIVIGGYCLFRERLSPVQGLSVALVVVSTLLLKGTL